MTVHRSELAITREAQDMTLMRQAVRYPHEDRWAARWSWLRTWMRARVGA